MKAKKKASPRKPARARKPAPRRRTRVDAREDIEAQQAALLEAQQEVELSRDRYVELYDEAPVGYVTLDSRGVILKCNLTAAEMLGVARAELLRKLLRRRVFPADQADFVLFLRELRKPGVRKLTELRLMGASDAVLHVQLAGTTAALRSGKFIEHRIVLTDLTERRLAQDAMRAQAEEFDRYFARSLELLCIVDGQGVFQRVNPMWEQVLGYSPEEMEGRRYLEFVHPEDVARTDKIAAQLDAEGTLLHFENRYRHKNGDWRWLSWRAYTHGPLIHAVARDITEQKNTQAQLQARVTAADAKYKAVFEQGLLFMGIMDLEGRLVECNRLALDACGYRREDELGRPFWKTGWWRASDEVQACIREATSEALAGRVFRAELPYVWADGTERWVDFTLSPVKDEAGRVIFLTPMGMDITERKLADAGLRESEERWKFALEATGMGAWSLNLTDHTAWRSLRHDQIFGYAELLPEWTYEKFLQHVLEEDRAQVDAQFQRALASQTNWDFECRIRRTDGDIRWIWAQGQRISGLKGISESMFGLVMDITERKEAETALREHARNMTELFMAAPIAATLSDLVTGEFIEVNPLYEALVERSRVVLIGRRSIDLGLLKDTKERQRIMAALRESGRVDDVELVLIMPDGREKVVRFSVTRMEILGRTCALSYGTDVTARQRAEIIQKQMLTLAVQLSAATTPEEAGQAIFNAADAWWDWDAGTLDVYSAADDQVWSMLYFDVVNGERREVTVPNIVSAPTPLMRRIMREGRKLILRSSPQQPSPETVTFGDTARLSASILCAPIRAQGRPVGILSIQSYRENAYTEDDLILFQALADHCGGTLERLQATRELRASEELIRLATEATGAGIWQWNVRTHQMRWDARMFAIYGIPPTADGIVAYTDWSAAVLAEDLPRQEEQLQDTLRRRSQGAREFRIRRQNDQACRQIQTVETVRTDASGEVDWVVGTSLDITERVAAEAALRTSHARYELVLAGANDAIWDWDVPNHRVHFSPRWKELRGFAPEEVSDREEEWSSGIYAEDLPRVMASVQDHFTGKTEHFAAEYRIWCKDGSLKWILDRGQAEWDEDGKVIRMAGSESDITGRKQAQLALTQLNATLEQQVTERTRTLKESEERFRAVAENLGDGLVLTDLEGRLIEVNPRMLEMSGYTRREVIGKLGLEIFNPPQHATEMKARTASRAKGASGSYVIELRRKDGSRYWGEITGAPVRDGLGRIYGTVRVVRDVTERRNIEAALQASGRFAATGRMAAGIAHEINNPLNGIRSSLLVVERALPPDHPDFEFIKLIKREISRISTIIQRLLGLYRPTREEAKEFSLSTLAQDVVKLSEHLGKTRSVEVRCVVPSSPCAVVLPEAAVSEVLYNLVKNAIEASPPRSAVELKLEVTDKEVLFTVSDQGHGIAEDQKGRVFEPFFTTKGSAGLGLGLAATRTQVKAMQGQIAFTTQPGKGTTFRVILPLRLADNEKQKESDHAKNTLRG